MSKIKRYDGLDGIVAGETEISDIDGRRGRLVVRGYDVADLVRNGSFEETLYLLWNGDLPAESERSTFAADLAAARTLEDATLDRVGAMVDRGASTMDVVEATVPMLRADGETAPTDQASRLVAKLPTVVAASWRLRQGREVLEPRDDLSHAANFLYMLTGDVPADREVRGLEAYLNALAEHELNASTFAARTVASTGADVVSAVNGAVSAFRGHRHGAAAENTLHLLEEVRSSGNPEGTLRSRLDDGERLPGFGHRVYQVRDPRAAVLEEVGTDLYGDGDYLSTAATTESVGVDLLADRFPDQNVEVNAQLYAVALLAEVGVPADLLTGVYVVARAAGWTAHATEQLESGRIVRPEARYVGAVDRSWAPVTER